MNFNSLFFPAPSVHYNMTTHFGEMIYIPKDFKMVSSDDPTEDPKPVLNLASFEKNQDVKEHSFNLLKMTKILATKLKDNQQLH